MRAHGLLIIHLKGDVVAEAYSRERDETVIEAVEVTPALVSREHRGARRDDHTREQTGRQHEIHLRGLGPLTPEIRLRPSDHHRRELIQSLADALEHHQPQGDTYHRVRHAERLTTYGHWSGVSVTLRKIIYIHGENIMCFVRE